MKTKQRYDAGLLILATAAMIGLVFSAPQSFAGGGNGNGNGNGGGNKPPFERTEQRAPCRDFDSLRQPFFGETHAHTGFSADAAIRLVVATPDDAYSFAKGAPLNLTDPNGTHTTVVQLDRPLDFAAVTDHSEFFGTMNLCLQRGTPAYDTLDCRMLRGFYNGPLSTVPGAPGGRNVMTAMAGILAMFTVWQGGFAAGWLADFPVCQNIGDRRCTAEGLSMWKKTQEAAERAYDRSSACRFTSFVAYELGATPLGINMHHNVIFRNANVTRLPISAIDITAPNPDPKVFPPTANVLVAPGDDFNILWRRLKRECTEAGTGCDVLTIPHNSNLGGGVLGKESDPAFHGLQMHPDPLTAQEAADRQRFEPLIELYQHKGESECHWDPRYGRGTETNDEDCVFEQLDSPSLLAAAGGASNETGGPGAGGGLPACPPGDLPIDGTIDCGLDDALPPEAFPPRSFVRNVMKDGLMLMQEKGFPNPFKYGFVAATDTHNADPGYVKEDAFHGGLGVDDAVPTVHPTNSPGGLGVVWAEENSRDAIFSAMKRRETYGTSGTRPTVRFFGGWNFDTPNICQQNFVKKGYQKGVPMGGDLPPRQHKKSPTFIAAASMDRTLLQQIQIIKGWVDASGETHEQVITVAGDPNNGATVNPSTCEPIGPGFDTLCASWTDPNFDPRQPAFYYSRVLENPVCRWSTDVCKEFNVDPFAANCAEQRDAAIVAGTPARYVSACCNTELSVPNVHQTIQERAWTSAIWYTPTSK